MAGPAQPIDPFYKGETRTFRYTVIDNDPTKATLLNGKLYTGGRVDISGASAIEWQAKYPTGSPYTPTVSLSLGSGIAIADQVAPETKGDFLVTIPSAATVGITAKRYKYDTWVVLAGEKKYVVRASDFNVLEPVNDAP